MEVLPVPIHVLEEEDERDEWSPPGSGRKLRDRLSKGKREEEGRGRKAISRGLSDWEPPWHACVACQLNENGKCNSKTSLIWQICKMHFKSGFWMCCNRKSGKYVKIPHRGEARL